MQETDLVHGLLGDLATITDVARAGVLSRTGAQLIPGETRPAAILFIDVVGFTDLARKLDSETLARFIDSAFRIFELTVKSFGGYCDKVIGDAGVYVFTGHPNHPPACEAALLTALALLDRAQQISESLKGVRLSLAVRVGVSFGEVTRMQVGGTGQQETVMGEAVNLAQRLQSAAEPGCVLITSRVLEIAGDKFIVRPEGEVELKGFGRVHTHRLLGAVPQPMRLRATSSALSPFVGRSELLDECQQLVSRWISVPAQEGIRMLTFRGPAAVGKSRMVIELLAGLQARQPVCYAAVHCQPTGSLSSFAAELCQLAQIDASNLEEHWCDLCQVAAERLPAAQLLQARKALPVLAYLLGCNTMDTTGVSQANADNYLRSLVATICSCIELATLDTPVVLVVEDLQWLGDAQQFLVETLTMAKPLRPVVIVATARPEAQPAAFDGCIAESRWIGLPPLPEAACRQLLSELLPGLSLPEPLDAELAERADGLPYYFEEFARMLIRRNLVQEQDGRYTLTADLDDLAIPENIHMLVLGRIDQLEPELKELVAHASILGRSFLKPLLKRLEVLISIANDADLEHGLSRLIQYEVLRTETGDRYFFEHLLTRDAIYRALLRSNRIALHRLAAEACRELCEPGTSEESTSLPELAHHLQAAQLPLAAHRACCSYLDLLAICGRLGDWTAWEERAQGLWEESRLADPTLPADSVRLLYAQSLRLAFSDTKQALELVERALAGNPEAQEADPLAMLNQLGKLQLRLGQPDAARATWQEALARALTARSGRARCALSCNLGTLELQRGQQDSALAYFQQALELAREIGRIDMQGVALDNLAVLHMLKGEHAAAVEHWEEALAFQRQVLNRQAEATVLHNMGCLLEKTGRLEDALANYRQELELFAAMGYITGQGAALNNIGSVLLKQGQPQAALLELLKADEIMSAASDQRQIAFLACDMASCYYALHDTAHAHAQLARATAIATQLGVAPDSELGRYIDQTALALKF